MDSISNSQTMTSSVWICNFGSSIYPPLLKGQCWLLWHRGWDLVGKVQAAEQTSQEVLLIPIGNKDFNYPMSLAATTHPPLEVNRRKLTSENAGLWWWGREKREGATALKSLRTTGHREKRELRPSLVLPFWFLISRADTKCFDSWNNLLLWTTSISEYIGYRFWLV